MEKEKNIKAKQGRLSKINLLLIIVIFATGQVFVNRGYQYMRSAEFAQCLADEKIKSLESRLEETEVKLSKLQGSMQEIELNLFSGIDFTDSDIQTISDHFLLVDAEQIEHLTGIKFKGSILNTQSVHYENVRFKLTVNKITKDFVVHNIPAGNSTNFTIYIPDINVKDARYGEIKYQESLVSYSKSLL